MTRHSRSQLHICCLIAALSILCGEGAAQRPPRVETKETSSKLWRSSDAPPAYLGEDLKLKQQPSEPGGKADGKFVISGKRPTETEGLDTTAAGRLTPIEIPVGTKSGKPVALEVFTVPGRAEEVADQLRNHDRWTELTEHIKASLGGIQTQQCVPPSVVTCVKFGKDGTCKEFGCERKKP